MGKDQLSLAREFYQTNGWQRVEKTVTMDDTVNANGDFNGTGNPSDIFTVTGTIVCKLYAICTTNIAGAAATLEVGTSTTTAGLIAQTTGTDIDAGEIWHDASPDSSVEADTVAAEMIVSDDIILTVGTADATGGVIKFILLWRQVTEDGNAVAA